VGLTTVAISILSPLAALCTVGFLARASYALARTPVLALFAVALGAGPEGVGLAVGISTLTGVLFKMPAGVLSDAVGRTRMLLLALGVFAFVPFAYLFVESYPALLIVRFLHGFATAIFGPVSMAVVVSAAGDRRAEGLAWFTSVTIIGNLLGAPLGGWLLTVQAGPLGPRVAHFHVVYGVVAALGMAALLLALWTLRGQRHDAQPDTTRTLRSVWGRFRAGVREILLDRRVLLTSNLEGVQNLSVGALEAFLPVYAVALCGFSPLQAGLLWAVQAVTTLASKPLLGRWSDRRGRHGLLFWGMFLCAVPFALIPWTREFPLLLGLSAVFGLGEAVVTSSAAALVADLCRERDLGAAMGTFGTLFDVGHASGPLLAGVLIAGLGREDFRPAFGIIAAILVAAAFLFRWGVREPAAPGRT
jgi:DHA1 family multidrug resistance protein-like MFS transporter